MSCKPGFHSEPFGFGGAMCVPDNPQSSTSTTQSSTPAFAVSTNGRCGPNNGNTRCAGNSCCSSSGWCGGDQRVKSDWCTIVKTRTNGIENGKFDGK